MTYVFVLRRTCVRSLRTILVAPLGRSILGFLARQLERQVSGQLSRFVTAARQYERQIEGASDEQLRQTSETIQHQALEDECNTASLMHRSAGLGAEVIRRELGFRLHDVQLHAAIATASGAIVELPTGEGKTIVCGLAAMLRGMFDSSVHVATTNEYLADRDFATVSTCFARIGLTSGLLTQSSSAKQTRAAYRSRITYGPGYLFGFDYLRDQLTLRNADTTGLGRQVLDAINGTEVSNRMLQVTHSSIIIDEADSVLLDEGTTPLILSGGKQSIEANADLIEPYLFAKQVANSLDVGADYSVDLTQRQITFTEQGLRTIHASVNDRGPLELCQPWQRYVLNALRAAILFHRDEQYVVQEGTIKLVDAFTGRIFDDRTLRDGMHQALEAKENVELNPPSRTLARITRQRFFRQYAKICGMTGTAAENTDELRYFYGVDTVVLDPHRTCRRNELPDRFFDSWTHKLDAIVIDAAVRHASGQPILVGTSCIRASRQVHDSFQAAGLDCVVLNGVQDASEAEIVSRAGQRGAITIATNMAGRGTDIRLSEQARQLGGLHVIGTQRHNSRRIDRQLAGRSARQGDPGSVQFFISADDEILRDHAPEIATQIRTTAIHGESKVDFTQELHQLQTRLETNQFRLRRTLVQHDNWLDSVREKMVHEHATLH